VCGLLICDLSTVYGEVRWGEGWRKMWSESVASRPGANARPYLHHTRECPWVSLFVDC